MLFDGFDARIVQARDGGLLRLLVRKVQAQLFVVVHRDGVDGLHDFHGEVPAGQPEDGAVASVTTSERFIEWQADQIAIELHGFREMGGAAREPDCADGRQLQRPVRVAVLACAHRSPIASAAESAVSQRRNWAPGAHVEWVPLEMRSGSWSLHTGPSPTRAASKTRQ